MTQTPLNTGRPFELGLYTFIDDGKNALTGGKKEPGKVIADFLETAELADQIGLDVIAIGEHHREEYLSSAPEVILAAVAARTKKIFGFLPR